MSKAVHVQSRVVMQKKHYITYSKKILKLFIVFSVSFGALYGLWASSCVGLTSGIYYGLITGVIGGTFFSIIIGAIDLLSWKKLARRFGTVNYSVVQERELSIPGSYDTVYERVLDSVRRIGGIKHINSNMDRGIITGKTRPNWRSFGETIEIVIWEDAAQKTTKIRIISRPRFKITLIDYGRNFENVQGFLSLLTNEVSAIS